MAGLSGVLGGGTLLRYTGDFALFPTSILQATLLPILLSHFSDDLAAGDQKKFKSTVVHALCVVSCLLLGASILLYALRFPMLRLIFLHGKMDQVGVFTMAQLLPHYLIGLVPFGALLILSRAHTALKNSKIMPQVGLLNVVLNVILNFVGVKVIGLAGIALATSCVQWLIAFLFWILLKQRLHTKSIQEAHP